jgi:hypothetical protein
VTASCFSTPLTGALTGARATSLSASLSASLPASLAGRVRPVLAAHPSRAARGLASAQSLRGLALVGLFLVLAALLAPEQPRAQAEICERHNGAAACRVW